MFILPQVGLHRLIQEGIKVIKLKPELIDEIFHYYQCDWANYDYGEPYIQQIKTWFVDTKIPVVQAWSLNPEQAPQIAIRLSSEQEDQQKAAMGDFYGYGEDSTIGMSPFSVSLEVLVMASKNSDQSLWLYYIVLYILFKTKNRAQQMGLQLHTVSATDHVRDLNKLADNIWVRSIRFSTVVQHIWNDQDYLQIDDLNLNLDIEKVEINKNIKGSLDD